MLACIYIQILSQHSTLPYLLLLLSLPPIGVPIDLPINLPIDIPINFSINMTIPIRQLPLPLLNQLPLRLLIQPLPHPYPQQMARIKRRPPLLLKFRQRSAHHPLLLFRSFPISLNTTYDDTRLPSQFSHLLEIFFKIGVEGCEGDAVAFVGYAVLLPLDLGFCGGEGGAAC